MTNIIKTGGSKINDVEGGFVWDEFYAQDDASLPNTNAPNLRLFRNDNVTPTDYAVVFDGSSGYGNLPDYASLDTAAADLSIRMYIKPNKIKQQTLVHRAGQFRVHMNAIGKITFEGPGGLSITSAASVTASVSNSIVISTDYQGANQTLVLISHLISKNELAPEVPFQ